MKFAVRNRVRINHLFVLALLPFARPTTASLIAGAALSVLGEAIRVTAAGVIRKDQSLATAGIYAHVRNPLYLGSFFLGAGFVVMAFNPVFAAIFLLVFIPLYTWTIRSEEEFLAGKFSDDFREYCRSVPRIIPRLTPFRDRDRSAGFSLSQALFNREFGGLVGGLITIAAMAAIWRFAPHSIASLLLSKIFGRL